MARPGVHYTSKDKDVCKRGLHGLVFGDGEDGHAGHHLAQDRHGEKRQAEDGKDSQDYYLKRACTSL